ncbi:unnamed protein product [Symbiodinium natans]|uniref:Uncharacterized protein n=1 Tax=Symbiodinium natans TaxID=878477 RepID=A0A812RAU0_9DINO|nr:unnamed protein product [Symbiodinium natans]
MMQDLDPEAGGSCGGHEGQKSGLPKRVRQDRGAKAAKKAAKMSKETWNKFQTAKYQKEWPKPDYMLEKIEVKAVRDGGQGAYRDRTYEIITRWTENTQIQQLSFCGQH